MAHKLGDHLLDNGLNHLDANATGIYLCSGDPADYTAATSTLALGNKTWAAGGAWGAPQAGDSSGRKVMSTQITDGSVTADGLASDWATVDSGDSMLLANGGLSASQQVYTGNTFTLSSFKIEQPSS